MMCVQRRRDAKVSVPTSETHSNFGTTWEAVGALRRGGGPVGVPGRADLPSPVCDLGLGDGGKLRLRVSKAQLSRAPLLFYLGGGQTQQNEILREHNRLLEERNALLNSEIRQVNAQTQTLDQELESSIRQAEVLEAQLLQLSEEVALSRRQNVILQDQRDELREQNDFYREEARSQDRREVALVAVVDARQRFVACREALESAAAEQRADAPESGAALYTSLEQLIAAVDDLIDEAEVAVARGEYDRAIDLTILRIDDLAPTPCDPDLDPPRPPAEEDLTCRVAFARELRSWCHWARHGLDARA